ETSRAAGRRGTGLRGASIVVSLGIDAAISILRSTPSCRVLPGAQRRSSAVPIPACGFLRDDHDDGSGHAISATTPDRKGHQSRVGCTNRARSNAENDDRVTFARRPTGPNGAWGSLRAVPPPNDGRIRPPVPSNSGVRAFDGDAG